MFQFSLISWSVQAVLLVVIGMAVVSGRSFHQVTSKDSIQDADADRHQTLFIESVGNVFKQQIPSRHKRQVPDGCPVHPDTPVMYKGKQTYFEFDHDQAAPPLFPGEDENLSCPATSISSWWPGPTEPLKATCPWKWVTKDTWYIGLEIYPRYITEAECLCAQCVNANALSCKKLRRAFLFYKKTGCDVTDPTKPVFISDKIKVTVGCYCANESRRA